MGTEKFIISYALKSIKILLHSEYKSKHYNNGILKDNTFLFLKYEDFHSSWIYE